MLTKEEATRLYNALVGLTLNPAEIYEKIELYTEKPKREVQVGDIYKTFDGQPACVLSIGGGNYPIEVNFIMQSEGKCAYYTKDGVFHAEGNYRDMNLNLYRRYKITEITGE